MRVRLSFLLAVPLLWGCVESHTGFVAKDAKSSVITIGAGEAIVSGTGDVYWRLWYIIDAKTRTCWFKLGDSVGELDCFRRPRPRRASI